MSNAVAHLDAARHWHLQRALALLQLGRTGDAHAARDTLGPVMVPEHRLMAHYDLATFRSGRGETARAFAHWAAAHALLAVVQPFSREDHLATIEANIAHLDRTRLSSGPRAQRPPACREGGPGRPKRGEKA